MARTKQTARKATGDPAPRNPSSKNTFELSKKRKAEDREEFPPAKRSKVDAFETLGQLVRSGGLDYQWLLCQVVPYLWDDPGWRSASKQLRLFTLRESVKQVAVWGSDPSNKSHWRRVRPLLSVCCLHGLCDEVEKKFYPYDEIRGFLYELADKFPTRSDPVLRHFCRTPEVARKYGVSNTSHIVSLTDDVRLIQRVHDWTGEWHAWTLEDAASNGRQTAMEYAHEHGASWGRGAALTHALNAGNLVLAARIVELGCPATYLSEGEIPLQTKEGLEFAINKFGYKPSDFDLTEGALSHLNEELFVYMLTLLTPTEQSIAQCIKEITSTRQTGDLAKAKRMLTHLLNFPVKPLGEMWYLVRDNEALEELQSTWLRQLFEAGVPFVCQREGSCNMPWYVYVDREGVQRAINYWRT